MFVSELCSLYIAYVHMTADLNGKKETYTNVLIYLQTEPLVAIQVVPYTFETAGMTTMKRKYIELVEEASLKEVIYFLHIINLRNLSSTSTS